MRCQGRHHPGGQKELENILRKGEPGSNNEMMVHNKEGILGGEHWVEWHGDQDDHGKLNGSLCRKFLQDLTKNPWNLLKVSGCQLQDLQAGKGDP